MSAAGLVTLLTDFGPGSVYVGQMHGVLLARAPDVRIVDLAHDCPPAGVAAAGYLLERSFRHFPAGSVHVAVVDPGVGSARKVLAARAQDHVFLAPDNGLLGPVLDGITEKEVRAVENRDLMAASIAPTFHGRDVFAPVAAYLAVGRDLAAVGPPTQAERARSGPDVGAASIEGRVLLVDRFGNLVTNVSRAHLQVLGKAARIRVRAGDVAIDGLVRTFSDVARDAALLYVGSGDHLEIAVRGGRASDVLGLGVGAVVHVERRM